MNGEPSCRGFSLLVASPFSANLFSSSSETDDMNYALSLRDNDVLWSYSEDFLSVNRLCVVHPVQRQPAFEVRKLQHGVIIVLTDHLAVQQVHWRITDESGHEPGARPLVDRLWICDLL